MEVKTRSFSYEFNGIRIKFMLEDLAAKSKRHNLDTWFDCCRKIAADSKLSVEFLVTFEPTIADPKKFGNRITAIFRDQGDPEDRTVPVCRIWRGRRKGLGWVEGQLVFDGDDMFIMTRDQNAGWCWFAVDQVESLG